MPVLGKRARVRTVSSWALGRVAMHAGLPPLLPGVGTDHMRMLLSLLPDTTTLLSGRAMTHCTADSWPSRTASGNGDGEERDQRRRVASAEEETIVWLGVVARPVTWYVWPVRDWIISAEERSQTPREASKQPEMRRWVVVSVSVAVVSAVT